MHMAVEECIELTSSEPTFVVQPTLSPRTGSQSRMVLKWKSSYTMVLIQKSTTHSTPLLLIRYPKALETPQINMTSGTTSTENMPRPKIMQSLLHDLQKNVECAAVCRTLHILSNMTRGLDSFSPDFSTWRPWSALCHRPQPRLLDSYERRSKRGTFRSSLAMAIVQLVGRSSKKLT